MSRMFMWTNFNGDILNWDVSNVENMYRMFDRCKFNKDISSWKINDLCFNNTAHFGHLNKEYMPKRF